MNGRSQNHRSEKGLLDEEIKQGLVQQRVLHMEWRGEISLRRCHRRRGQKNGGHQACREQGGDLFREGRTCGKALTWARAWHVLECSGTLGYWKPRGQRGSGQDKLGRGSAARWCGAQESREEFGALF